jgi:hypothetical protein
MRLLVLLQGASVADQPGYDAAFNGLLAQGALQDYVALPYRAPEYSAGDQARTLYTQALKIVAERGVDLILLQWFHGNLGDPRPFVEEARRIRPGLLVMTTCGDPYGRFVQLPPRSLLQAVSVSDLSFTTSMGYMADRFVAVGGRNVLLMPHGVCQLRFGQAAMAPSTAEFDVTFIGSNNSGRNPFSPLGRAGRQRLQMVQALESRYGKRFGLFGLNWEGRRSWQGPIPFRQQHQTAARGRIQVGGYPGSLATYYLSDRPYIAMASGIPFVDFAVDGVDRLAEPGTHWNLYADQASMQALIDRMLESGESELAAMGQRAREYVLGSQTQAHRAAEMVDIARELARARAAGEAAAVPHLRCFHGGVVAQREARWASRGWVG